MSRKWLTLVILVSVSNVIAGRSHYAPVKKRRLPNSVSIKNGKVTSYDYIKTLKQENFESEPLRSSPLRSGERWAEIGSSQSDSIFSGLISIIDSFAFQSPFANGVFNDDLLDENSVTYVRGIIEAFSILSALLTPVLKSIGIDNFSILILGFSSGSVRINYELQISSEDLSLAGNPGSIEIEEALQNHIAENSDYVVSVNGANSALLDNSFTSLSGGDGDVLTSNCPTCWKVSDGLCVPDENYIQIDCSQSNKLTLKADSCILESLDLTQLSLNGGCNSDSGNIYENEGELVAWTTLDGCTGSKQFSDKNVVFGNVLTGVHSGTWNDQFRIEFTCSYPIDRTVNHQYEIESALHWSNPAAPVTSYGNLGFEIDFYKNQQFDQLVEGPFRVGTTLSFGVHMTTSIANVEFTVTDCNIYSDSDTQHPDTKHYAIFKNQCPNQRVKFQIYQGTDHSLTTFSYKVFEFKNGAAMSSLHLICSVVVCEVGDSESVCNVHGDRYHDNAKSNCDGGNRGRRGVDDGNGLMYYQVSRSFGYV